MFGSADKLRMPSPGDAPPGREEPMPVSNHHFVNGNRIKPPFPEGMATAIVGMGCFWGAEKAFWQVPGVHSTAVGYSAGYTPNPTYQEVCAGQTGHNEVVLVVFDPAAINFGAILQIFWEGHDPTQGMRQGNDMGTQYRSGIYACSEAQASAAQAAKAAYQQALTEGGHGEITTEIIPASSFYYAEEDHQQYLAKNPGGYCGMGGTGVSCPAG